MLGIVLLGCNPQTRPLPEEEPVFSRGELLYENDLSAPGKLEDWKIEGPGKLEFRDGWMHMYAPDEEYHHVLWCPEDFPGSFMAEWEVQNLETDGGLCIVFFAAGGLNGEDIFDASLPGRDGTFSDYTKGKMDNYHISYYANNPEYEPGRGTGCCTSRWQDRTAADEMDPFPLQEFQGLVNWELMHEKAQGG